MEKIENYTSFYDVVELNRIILNLADCNHAAGLRKRAGNIYSDPPCALYIEETKIIELQQEAFDDKIEEETESLRSGRNYECWLSCACS
jgi:hypothetical protein